MVMQQEYWLMNVLLEKSYEKDRGVIVGTTTELCHLHIKEGIIVNILSADQPVDSNIEKIDGKMKLLMPSFIEKHVHLDKTFLGGPWVAVKQEESIIDQCKLEHNRLIALTMTTEERAIVLLDKLLQNGSTHVRTHVDIYPEVGLENIVEVMQALTHFSGRLSYEVVAFPQHGLVRKKAKSMVRDALCLGAGIVGGVDPASVDGNIEESLFQMMDLAVEANAEIDLHLHDSDYLGIYTMKRLAALTMDAGWQGRVNISHAFALGQIPLTEAEEMADLLVEASISITTALQHNVTLPPVPLLKEKGVRVAVGSDNIYDAWRPFGNGDLLERVGRLTNRFHLLDEYSLDQSLGYITNGITLLDKEGNRMWPIQGSEANMVLVEAGCVAEAIARRVKRIAVFFQGKLVAGTIHG